MESLSVIKRRRHRDHFSIREISRRMGLLRNAVRRYLCSDAGQSLIFAPNRALCGACGLTRTSENGAGLPTLANRGDNS